MIKFNKAKGAIDMLKKILLLIFCFGLPVNGFASSPDAWKAFREEVKPVCEQAAPELLKLHGYSIKMDPYGASHTEWLS
jgi:hypothetical protein